MTAYLEWIQRVTEACLTRRRVRLAREKAARAVKKTFKGELFSWLDAIVFAVIFVLLLNQYLFQLFMIPSPSMEETLLIKDRVFVSKTSYGIELYPGGPKILDRRIPLRDDVIVFYNPEYESKGPIFDVLSQIVYMASFSLVNIDVDDEGNMRERLYVKRAAALAGDTVRFSDGSLCLKSGGQPTFTAEKEYRLSAGLSEAPHQSIESSRYAGINAYGALMGYQEAGLSSASPAYLLQAYRSVADYRGLVDHYQVEHARTRTLHQIDPSDIGARSLAARYEAGIYVPEGHVLPLGDNRDNSQDGRYFGPVEHKDVIGRVRFRFWPLGRMGGVS